MPQKSGTNRDLFPGHGAGKGDAERCGIWRDKIHEVNFHPEISDEQKGFVKAGNNRIRKTYGQQAKPMAPAQSEWPDVPAVPTPTDSGTEGHSDAPPLAVSGFRVRGSRVR